MLAICDQHDQFTRQMRNRLKTTGMGLGLVRLLMDAGLTEEARTTLSSLQYGFQCVGGFDNSLPIIGVPEDRSDCNNEAVQQKVTQPPVRPM